MGVNLPVRLAFFMISILGLSRGSADSSRRRSVSNYPVGILTPSLITSLKAPQGFRYSITSSGPRTLRPSGPNVCGSSCCRGWKSGTATLCIIPVCTPHCVNGGHCMRPSVCVCPSSYTGANCAEKIHKDSKSDRKRGTRQTLVNSYANEPSRVSGLRPQVVCSPTTCFNGGTCVDGSCICPDGYEGRKCEKVVVIQMNLNSPLATKSSSYDAALELCQTMCVHGSCSGWPQPTCRCRVGYYGSRCDRPRRTQARRITNKVIVPGIRYADTRLRLPTSRSGTSSGTKYGKCFKSFQGKLCGLSFNQVLTQQSCCAKGLGDAWGPSCAPCSRFRVKDRGQTRMHRCPRGFLNVYGACRDIDECRSKTHTCSNGACINSRGSYWCRCNTGYHQHASRKKCLPNRTPSYRAVVRHGEVCYLSPNSRGGCGGTTQVAYGKKTACCCSIGFAWGTSCELCPKRGSAEYDDLCPHGPRFVKTVPITVNSGRTTGNIVTRRLETTTRNSKKITVPSSKALTLTEQMSSSAEPTQQSTLTRRPMKSSTIPVTHTQHENTDHDDREKTPRRVVSERSTSPANTASPVIAANEETSDSVETGMRPTELFPDSSEEVVPDESGNADVSQSSNDKPDANNASSAFSNTGESKSHASVATATRTSSTTSRFLTQSPVVENTNQNTTAELRLVNDESSMSGTTNLVETFSTSRNVVSKTGSGKNHVEEELVDMDLLPEDYDEYGEVEVIEKSFPDFENADESEEMDDFDRIDLSESGESLVTNIPKLEDDGHQPHLSTHTEESDRIVATTVPSVQSEVSLQAVERPPSLQADACSPNPCENDGECAVGANLTFHCSCAEGYLGQKCQKHVCDNIPCSHGTCSDSRNGYQCLCDSGYVGSDCDQDLNECIEEICGSGGECINTDGSFECVCKEGYISSISKENYCEDVNECIEEVCGPGGECVNTDGSFKCICREGYESTIIEENYCADVNECVEEVCGPGGVCVNTDGSFKCICLEGYESSVGEENYCKDVNECVAEVCGQGGECVNTDGSFRCECTDGYQSSIEEHRCEDVNECIEDVCGPGGDCINTDGSFKCVCRDGYESSIIEENYCKDVDECIEEVCDPGGECINTDGSFKCICREGYESSTIEENNCKDVNECIEEVCGPGGECINTNGSFKCICREGYEISINKSYCEDVNECIEEVCDPGGDCINTDGSFKCICRDGYESSIIEENNCKDVDECIEDVCGPGGECINADGSFKCICRDGYESSIIEENNCKDVNECIEEVCGPGGECINTNGSFKCVCMEGYEISINKSYCEDINECVEEVCGPGGSCANTNGSYQCTCQEGYELLKKDNLCQDIDECIENTCGEGGMCRNNVGSFTCVCQKGYQLSENENFCEDVDECDAIDCGESASCQNHPGGYACTCRDENEKFDEVKKTCVSLSSSGEIPQEIRKACYSTPYFCRNVLSQNLTREECCCTIGRSWGDCDSKRTCPMEKDLSGAFKETCPFGRGFLSGRDDEAVDIDECKVYGNDGICRNGLCVNSIGGYRCECYRGFYYNRRIQACDDINECRLRSKCVGGFCINLRGSYKCHCPAGTTMETRGFVNRCIGSRNRMRRPRINQRRRQPRRSRSYRNSEFAKSFVKDACFSNATCSGRLKGAYSYKECCCSNGVAWGTLCSICPRQHTEDFRFLCQQPVSRRVSHTFKSVSFQSNKRSGSPAPSDGCVCKNGDCSPTARGRTCECDEGFKYDDVLITCLDIDECEESKSVCSNAECLNQIGSFRCICHSGYHLANDAKTCERDGNSEQINA